MVNSVLLAISTRVRSLGINKISTVLNNSSNIKRRLWHRTIIQQRKFYDVKRLLRLSGFDMQKWSTEGYNICLEGIKCKFVQNPLLMQMLKATGDKVIVEASTDKLWETAISLRDNQALNPNYWHSIGWMSSILMDIRDNT